MSERPLLTLHVLTPEGIMFELTNLDSINVPLADGCPIGIRPGHAPLIAETTMGSVAYVNKNRKQHIELFPGVLQIRNNVVTILTAGQFGKELTEPVDQINNEYDRLMQTLIKKLSSDQESDLAQKNNEIEKHNA